MASCLPAQAYEPGDNIEWNQQEPCFQEERAFQSKHLSDVQGENSRDVNAPLEKGRKGTLSTDVIVSQRSGMNFSGSLKYRGSNWIVCVGTDTITSPGIYTPSIVVPSGGVMRGRPKDTGALMRIVSLEM